MALDRYGFVDGLAAQRPFVVTLVLSFGLTALGVAGVADPEAVFRSRAASPNLLIAVLVYSTAPLLLVALAPQKLVWRFVLAGAVFAALVIAPAVAPFPGIQRFVYPLDGVAAIAALSIALILAGPALFGAMTRFAFVATISASLGLAGALGFMAMERIGDNETAGLLATLGFSLGAAGGLGAAADFSILFARGADAKRAAGVAAKYGSAPALYAVIAAAAAAAVIGWETGAPDAAARLAWIGGAAAFFAAIAALFMTTGALSLRSSNELAAIRENRRQQAFRRNWRPIRRALPPSSATALVAILTIVAIAAAFNLKTSIDLAQLGFIAAVSAAAMLVFLSLRTGLFVLIVLMVCLVISTWAWQAADAMSLSLADLVMASAFATALVAQLAVAWRDASSPRLNARETTEAAMSDAAPAYALSAAIGAAGFLGADAAGIWPNGADAALLLGVMAGLGLVVSPAVMTMLSHVLRRRFR